MIVPHGDDDDLIAGFGDEGDLFDERFRGSRLPSCWLFFGGMSMSTVVCSLRSILCTPENFAHGIQKWRFVGR